MILFIIYLGFINLSITRAESCFGHGVTAVHDEVCVLQEFGQIDALVICGDEDAVVVGNVFGRPSDGLLPLPFGMFSGESDFWNVWVEIIDFRAEFLEDIHEMEAG